MPTLFAYLSYKDYLKEVLKSTRSKGFQKRMSLAAGCQAAYLSQSLHGKAQLNEDHAYGISEFLGLTDLEQEYFISLVQLERASNYKFKNYLMARLEKLKDKNLSVSKIIKKSKTLSVQQQAEYHSDWLHYATHMLLGMPEFQNKLRLKEKLNISEKKLNTILDTLQSCGFAVIENSNVFPGSRSIHLSDDSPFISQLHTNYRLLAAQCAKEKKASDLQYSSMVTLSESDAIKAKSKILEFVSAFKEDIKTSPEEVLYSFNIDFFNPLD